MNSSGGYADNPFLAEFYDSVVPYRERFYDKIPLNVGAFEQYQSRLITTFAPDGVTVVDGSRLFGNSLPGDGLRNPYSLAANLQVDHQLTGRLLLRVGYEQRHTRREFFVEPVTHQDSTTGALLLQNSGRSRYREFQTTARLRSRRDATSSCRMCGPELGVISMTLTPTSAISGIR